MLRFAADEGFNRNVIAELRRRDPSIDIATVQERNLRSQPDPVILEWAASEGRVLLTHDVNSMRGLAADRIRSGAAMPGVLVVHWNHRVGQVADAVELAAGASLDGEWENRVEYLPLP